MGIKSVSKNGTTHRSLSREKLTKFLTASKQFFRNTLSVKYIIFPIRFQSKLQLEKLSKEHLKNSKPAEVLF
jgi:hypothetical protein